jgi:nitrogen fixation/metabolism regulation signal transduction histidine kinase
MTYKTFSAALISRLIVLQLLMLLVAWLVITPGYYAALLIATGAFAIVSFELWRLVKRMNHEVSRFLDAARYADFSQRFNFTNMGAGFATLGEAFTDILENLRNLRSQQEAELRHLKALVEHVPVPLFSIHTDESITLQNNAARRLFGTSPPIQVTDLAQFGSGFQRGITEAVPGGRALVKFVHDGMEQLMTLEATELVISNKQEKLISLQNIQSELDLTQEEAWQDLVRVLTHEIMNSITPVSSLAHTASDLADDLVKKLDENSVVAEGLADIHDAVSTVARRSDSLTQFVQSYRQLTRLAPPEKNRVSIAGLFADVSQLAAAEWSGGHLELTTTTTPQGLDVYADRNLLEPVLLNLLRNAWQATTSVPNPRIALAARMNRRGHVVIEVSDNGPGVSREIARKVFVPFFTTKEGGSGVGLALTRQVMIAHRGFVTLSESEQGGAKFSLIF